MPRPTARATRGRSRPGRLRLLDTYLLDAEAPLLGRHTGAWAGAIAVDVGLGAEGWTTRELAEALAPHRVRVVGVESDPERVRGAQRTLGPGFEIREATFLPPDLGPIRLVRAANLLRGYPAAEAPSILATLGAPLLEGGLLLEATTCRTGRVVVARLLRRHARHLAFEGLLVATDFSLGFSPAMFLRFLHRDLRGALDPWWEAWNRVRTADPVATFDASVHAMGGVRAGPGRAVLPHPVPPLPVRFREPNPADEAMSP